MAQGPGHQASRIPPSAKAAQTKRDRTRKAILQALRDLLALTEYDNLRVAEIAERAEVGSATFYTAFGQKAAAVAALFQSIYETVELETARKISEAATPPEDILRDHFRRLGVLAVRERPVSRAFLRVYGCEVLGSGVRNELVNPVAAIAQRLIETLGQDSKRYARLYVGDNLGLIWTMDIITMAIPYQIDIAVRVVDRLLDTYLPGHEPPTT